MKDVRYIEPRTVICDKHHCHCGTDIIIPKRKLSENEIEVVQVEESEDDFLAAMDKWDENAREWGDDSHKGSPMKNIDDN